MDTASIIFAVGLALSLQLTTSPQANAQFLTAHESSVRLPTEQYHLTGLYDNDDTIYLFGGSNSTGYPIDQILRYSISEDKLEAAGRLPIPAHSGAALMNKEGSIFYIQGAEGSGCNGDVDSAILQYFPDSQTFRRVSSIQLNYFYAYVKPDEETALLFGGHCHPSNMVILNMTDMASEVIENALPNPQFEAAGIWVEKQEAAYIFHTGEPSVQKFSSSANRTDILPIQLGFRLVPRAVWDGRYGYLIGGANSRSELGDNYIVQFDPDTETASFIRVVGLPDEVTFSYTSAVYVEKLNRIYLFGGMSFDGPGTHYDKIWYINLDPLNPPPSTTINPPISTEDPGIFDCAGRPNGNYAFPGDCAKFIVCLDDKVFQFECPETLLFHQINRGCTLPQLVDCNSSCSV